MSQNSDPKQLLAAASVNVLPGMFTMLSLGRDTWLRLLQDPDLSPRMSAPFMIFYDGSEITLLLDETDFGVIAGSIGDAPSTQYRLLTFDIVLKPDVVGFMALVSQILASADVPIMALSAYSRDHVLIRQHDLAKALAALGPYVADLC